MLSKNLYEIDEVVAALQLCLRMSWPRAHFWAHELIVSEEEELLRTTLRDAWLDYGAPADMSLYMDLRSSNISALVSRVMEAIRVTGSLSPISLFTKASSGHRPRVTPATSDPTVLARRAKGAAAFLAATDTENMDPDHLKAWWISFDSACRCHWFRDAFWLLQAVQPTLSSEGIWAGIMLAARGLSEVKEFIQGLRDEGSLRAQAAAVATLCYPSRQQIPVPRSQYKSEDWSLSGRKARLYAIPAEALHRQTTRGSLSTKYTNIQDIREPILLLPQGCAYWRRISAAAGFIQTGKDEVECPEDEAYESFYDRYFPDDIPDEWSAADQQKSHGRGLLEKAGDPPTHIIRDQISEKEWAWGIHVPAKKLTK
jgi:hypothetical protein